MLSEWLHPRSLAEFRDAHLGRAPLAGAGTAMAAAEQFQWSDLEPILASAPDAIVVARGEPIPMPAPRELIEVKALLRSGIGVVIRRAETSPAGARLRDLAGALTTDLPGDAHVQLFVTPGDSHSFGWHYDFEEVFIVQTAGVKEYFFRANTVDPAAPPSANPDFTRFRDETSPLMTARLHAGDWLYLPARWWHAARCVEHSLSMSIGILPR